MCQRREHRRDFEMRIEASPVGMGWLQRMVGKLVKRDAETGTGTLEDESNKRVDGYRWPDSFHSHYIVPLEDVSTSENEIERTWVQYCLSKDSGCPRWDLQRGDPL